MTVKPPPLMPGDTIGIVSLGSPINKQHIKNGINTLNKMGYNVILANHALSNSFPTAPPLDRANDLIELFLNPNVKMIMGSRGGTGTTDILPYLDFNVIKENPKIFSGYSDLSLLLNMIYQSTNLITINGLMLLDIHSETPEFNLTQFFSSLYPHPIPRKVINPKQIPFISKVPGNVTGPIIGGNLTSLVGSLGTPYEIDTKEKILFLEDINESSSRMYRLLSHLKLAGKLSDCKGIIMGECTDCKIDYDTSYGKMIDNLLVPLRKPLMTNLATGHGKYKVTIPIGSVVNLNTIQSTLTILEPTVTPFSPR